MSTTYHAAVTSKLALAPLPDPDDPSLNDPIITVRAPDQPYDHDTIMAMLDAETQSIPEFKNPGALHLFNAGLHSKAIDREHCSKYGILEECSGKVSPIGQKHRNMVYLTCHQRYCKYCAPAIMRKNLAHWYESHPYLRRRHNFAQIFLVRDFDRLPTGEDFDDFNAAILAGADLAGNGPQPGTGAVWNSNIRHLWEPKDGKHLSSGLVSKGYRLEAKFIWWGDFQPHNHFENIHAELKIIPAQSFDLCMKDLMEYDIPSDPIDCAQFELIVHGRRTLRSAGGFVRAKNVTPEALPDISEELFPTGTGVGNSSQESTPSEGSTSQKPPKPCHVCGADIVRRSGKVSVDATPEELEQVSWYDIQPPG